MKSRTQLDAAARRAENQFPANKGYLLRHNKMGKTRHLYRNMFLIIFFIVTSQPVVCQTNQDVLEPSKSLFFAEEDMTSQDDLMTSEGEWGLGESCHFEAIAGRLFNTSVAYYVTETRPQLVEEGTKFKVQFVDDDVTNWLVFKDDVTLLQGVPLSNHVGLPYHYVITVLNNDVITATIPCSIQVNDVRDMMTYQPDIDCHPTEAIATISLTLEGSIEDLTFKQRVDLVLDLCTFMGSKVNPAYVTIEQGSPSKHNAYMVGQGDGFARGAGVVISWPMACGSDATDWELLRRIEVTTLNGEMSNNLGLKVVQWRVENRKQHLRNPELLRKKRQSDLNRFKSPTYPRPRATPHPGIDPDFDLLADSPGIYATPILPLEESIDIPQKGRKRIHIGMLRASPVPYRPPGATRLPDHVFNRPKLPSPSSPVPKLPLSLLPEMNNTPPENRRGIDDVTVKGSTYFEHRIERDVFYDLEEGDTGSLTLSLVGMASFQPTWLMLDSPSLLIYGVAPRPIKGETTAPTDFLLIAEDSGGKSTTDSFSIHLTSRPRALNHRFTLVFTHYDDTIPPHTIDSIVGRLLTIALGSLWDDVAPPGHVTFAKVDKGQQQLVITWFDNSLGSKTQCNLAKVRRLWAIMSGNDDVTKDDQRDRAIRDFADNFRPKFRLKYVKLSLFGPCANSITTTTSSTRSTTTTTESTTTTSTTTTKPALPTPPPPTKPPTFTTTTTRPATITYPTTTSTTTTTTLKPITTLAPMLLTDPNYVIKLSTNIGKQSTTKIPKSLFQSRETPVSPILVPWGDGLPMWVAVDSSKWTLVGLPTIDDVTNLQRFNSTHVVWKGGVSAVTKLGVKSERVLVEVYVADPTSSGGDKFEENHLFTMRIKNYNLKNFTALDSSRLINVIRGIWGDRSASNIFVYPPTSGSVVFSWCNSSLSFMDECPFSQIAAMATKIFESVDQINRKVIDKFFDAGFDVDDVKLQRKNSCLKKKPRVLPPTTTLTPPEVTTTTTTKDEEEEIQQAGGDSATSIIIIAVVIVCVVIVIIVAVVKCRMNSARSRKRKETPIRMNEHGSNNIFKAATPIVFDGEIDATQPLTTSTFTQKTSQNGDQNIVTETTPFNNEETRPPPPPYIPK